MGMHILPPGMHQRRIGIGAFEVAIRCALEHRKDTVAGYMRIPELGRYPAIVA